MTTKQPTTQKATIYCLKCCEEREIQVVQSVLMRNGRYAKRGICPVCRDAVFWIGKS